MATLRSELAPGHCPAKPKLGARPLLTGGQTESLQRLFKVLANDSRLRLLHALVKAGELCVSDLAEKVGMTQQAISNQLRRLSDAGILASRRDGLRIYYTIVDPCVPNLLDQALCLVEDSPRRRP